MLPIELVCPSRMLHVALAVCCMLPWRCMLHVGGLGCMSPAHYGNTSLSLCFSLSAADLRCTPRDCHHTKKEEERPLPKPQSPNPNRIPNRIPIRGPKNPRKGSCSPRAALFALIKPNKYYLCIFWVIVSTPPRPHAVCLAPIGLLFSRGLRAVN